MSSRPWELELTARASRDLAKLPVKVAFAVVEFMTSPLLEDPQRMGHPLTEEFAGLWSARRGPYRIIYQIDDEAMRVRVVSIGHRRHIYRRR